jgi:hypothetical protein
LKVEDLESRDLPSAPRVALPIYQRRPTTNDTTPLYDGFTAAEIRTAYGINRIAGGNSGAGQTIAIVDSFNNPNIFFDLDSFDQTMTATPGGPSLQSLFGNASSLLTVYDQNGNVINVSNTNVPVDLSGGWEGEEALDVEWAHAIAPAAHLDLVEGNSDFTNDLYAADQTAARLPGVSAVSNSWGAGEYIQENGDDATFAEPANHPGVTFLFSSGDGSTGEYPSFSPDVVSVGGTSLYLNADNSIGAEDAWSTDFDYGWGTGGGTSQYEREPSYQFGVQGTGNRTSPDVSLVADPFTGVAIYDSYNNPPGSGWEEVGGTSVACPCWAGILSIANAARVADGKQTFGSSGDPQAALTALYSMPQSDFHDVALGFIASQDGNTYYAGPGYDEVTGLGTPVADRLVQDLASYTAITQPFDPSFETPTLGIGFGAYTFHPTGSPWTFSGGAGVAGFDSGFTSGNPYAPQGDQVAFLQDNGIISQSVNFAAGSYVLNFDAAQRANWQASFQTVGVYVDHTWVGTIQPSSTNYLSYSSRSFSVAAGNHLIEFIGFDPNGGDNTAFLDEVSIQNAPVNQPVDAGFETPGQGFGFGAYTYCPSGSAWTFTGGTGLTGFDSAFTSGNLYLPQGNQVAFLQDNGFISQNVNFTAGTYVLTLYAAQRANWQASFQTIGVYVDHNPVATIQPSGTEYLVYSTHPFSVSAGTHTIQLVGLDPNGGDNTAFVDQVGIVSATANQPFDPNFATPLQGYGFSAYTYAPTGSAWTFSGGAGLTSNGSGFTSGNPAAPGGSQVAFLQAVSIISQNVNLTAGDYVIALDAAQRANWQASFQIIGVYVDGTRIGTVKPSGTSYLPYSTSVFSAAAGSHTIAFVGLNPNGGDNTAFLDQVVVQDVAADQVVDPGFETPAQGSGYFGAFAYDPTGSAWAFSGAAGLTGNGSGFTSGNPSAPQGNQAAFLQGYGSISQSVDFTAGSYVITVDAAQRGNSQASTQTIEILVDGAVVGTITPAGTAYAAYSSKSFIVTAGLHKIAFDGLDPLGGDNTALLDQVTIAAI